MSLRNRVRLNIERLEDREVPASGMAIGMNLEHVSDFMAAWMFTDGFKESRPWMPMAYNTVTHSFTPDPSHPAVVDSHGWPTQLIQYTNSQGQLIQQVLATVMMDGLSGHYPAGTYTAWWQGTGTVQWSGDAHAVQTGTMANGTHFAMLSDTPGNAGIQMRITAMSSTDPIHDMHVWLPNYNGHSFVGQVWHPGANFSPFHPLFLQMLSPFKTLRFMQDQDTITSQVQHWSDLKPYDYETQASWAQSFQNGIAPEYMIEMANELKANLWVNMPHMADNNFITHFATMVRNGLNPGLKTYVEWSNEVWNGAPGFMPHQWIEQQLALPQNAGVTFDQFVAREFRNTFDIWSQVFAGQTNRMVRVAAGFEANPYYTAHVLQDLGGDFDAVSCAAYFGPTPIEMAGYSASTTENQVMTDTIGAIPTWLHFIQQHEQLAQQYTASLGQPIQLVAYEGGANLTGGWQPYAAAMNAAANDSRMYNAYQQWLTGCNNIGMNAFVNFEYTDRNMPNTPYGIFGALNYQDEPIADAPKYRALLAAVDGAFWI